MKNEFMKELQKDEELLVYGVSDVSKTSKQLGRFIFGLIMLTIFWTLSIIGLKNNNVLSFNVLIIMVVLCILTLCLIYGLIYNIYLKYKKKNSEYFVTNKRIAIYNFKTGLRIENIMNINHIGIIREKNNYGDLIINFISNNLTEQMKKGMSFEGIENPRKIIGLITNINNKIHIYDDRPTIMGQKV